MNSADFHSRKNPFLFFKMPIFLLDIQGLFYISLFEYQRKTIALRGTICVQFYTFIELQSRNLEFRKVKLKPSAILSYILISDAYPSTLFQISVIIGSSELSLTDPVEPNVAVIILFGRDRLFRHLSSRKRKFTVVPGSAMNEQLPHSRGSFKTSGLRNCSNDNQNCPDIDTFGILEETISRIGLVNRAAARAHRSLLQDGG